MVKDKPKEGKQFEEDVILRDDSNCWKDNQNPIALEKLSDIFPICSSKIKGERMKENNQEKRPAASTQNSSTNRLRLVSTININIELDFVALFLFVIALATRFYKLAEPRSIVFDELHYGKYVSLYLKRTFFFDTHPPLGKQLVAAMAYFASFEGNFTFEAIGSPYSESVPIFALRFVPAFCGSLVIPLAYHLLLELGLRQLTAVLAAFLLLCDNALLTQSRFILMEPMLLCFSLFGLLCVLKFRKYQTNPLSLQWWGWLSFGMAALTCAVCIKHVGFFSYLLGLAIVSQSYWHLIADRTVSNFSLICHLIARCVVVTGVSIAVYLAVFYIHFTVLYKAGPHDSVMTSAFQASLEGGLASITRGQPLQIAHGSQITLRHTHGTPCWLHSHTAVYPVLYPDKRGSSHQQQVTCYTYKDVNNWWLVKRPEKNDFVVSEPLDVIKHGDLIQLVHGLTNRALNSHDVAAPMTPNNQEVSCYIDYNVSMPAQNLWRVEILNRDQVGNVWHTIESLVRLVHVNTTSALKWSARQLPEWGYNQHEITADRNHNQDSTIWNVEEHRYTKNEDQKDRERELVNAEMIPLQMTALSLWDKLWELQYKMLFASTDKVQSHMYSSDPFEWPLMTRGMAYWVSTTSNAQIHLLGNVAIWFAGTLGLAVYCCLLVFYLLRRRRCCYDLSEESWQSFLSVGQILLGGFLFHFVPYFFVEQTLFLHHYLPALVFKVLLLCVLIEHIHTFLLSLVGLASLLSVAFKLVMGAWLLAVFVTFRRFTVLSYGTTALSALDIIQLRWRETWDFIIHRP